jgi:transposase-like protein
MSHHTARRRSSAAHSTATCHLLAGLAKEVIEAVLEAELADHLARQFDAPDVSRGFANTRNGTRRKTVRTALGAIALDAPRDRWGTFAPVAVGKWQREVVGIDRILVPLAARGAPTEQTVDLLALALPESCPGLLRRMTAQVRERLHPWHYGPLDAEYPGLQVHLSDIRDSTGRATGFPVASVVGVGRGRGEDGLPQRELLALYAVSAAAAAGNPWYRVLADLRDRGMHGVEHVVGERADLLREPVAQCWPDAEVSQRHAPPARHPHPTARR